MTLPRMPRLLSRARAVQVARRLAADALQRLSVEADRLSHRLQRATGPLPLRGSSGAPPLDVGAPSDPVDASPGPAEERADAPAEEAEGGRDVSAPQTPCPPPPPLSPGLAQVAQLRRRMEPQILSLRINASYEEAEDPTEAVHQLRVSSRRLRSFVALFSPVIGDKPAARLRRRLRRITRGVGPLREWDVNLERLRALHDGAEPLPRAALEHVIAWAEQQRSPTVAEARKAVRRVDTETLACALEDALDRICGRLLRLEADLDPLAWTLLEPELERAFAELPVEREETDVEPLHEVRTRAKRLRYALELLKPTMGDGYRRLRRPARAIQRALGDHHDLSLLVEMLQERRDVLVEQGLHTLAGALEPVIADQLAHRHRRWQDAAPALGAFEYERYAQLTRAALGVPAPSLAAGDPGPPLPAVDGPSDAPSNAPSPTAPDEATTTGSDR